MNEMVWKQEYQAGVPGLLRIYVPRNEQFSEKTMNFKEQIKSKDKYPSIFLRQMKVLVYIILEIFFATRAVFKIGEYYSDIPQF